MDGLKMISRWFNLKSVGLNKEIWENGWTKMCKEKLTAFFIPAIFNCDIEWDKCCFYKCQKRNS